MRIIAGTYRSRVLKAPPGLHTRPTSDRLRETLFNVLAPRIQSAAFLDLYAGSGAVGIEALSRGAAHVTFVERARAPLKALRENLSLLEIESGFDVQATTAGAFLRSLAEGETWLPRYDLVFVDPPYDVAQEYETALGLLGAGTSGVLAQGALVIAEHRRKQQLEERYGGLRRTRLLEQGDATLSFFEP
jgi:16S rRNA (guanine966-N2)-methyltransferase